MAQKDFIGKKHHQLMAWLRDTWIPAGPPVCFLEGFPGVGKSNLARKLMAASPIPPVWLEIPDSSTFTADDLLLNLAQEWSIAGNSELAETIAAGKDTLPTLARLLQNPVFIVMDEFQNAMTGEQASLSGSLADLFQRLARNTQAKGRILLLTNRIVERGRWSEAFEKKSLEGLDADDGSQLLNQILVEAGRADEVPPESRASVVHWLGGNPRALNLLVTSLAYTPLDELVSINPDTWEYPERAVSPELIQKIEREMLERILSRLGDEFHNALYQLSVFRKSFKNKALEQIFPQKEMLASFKAELINQFLMEQHGGWFSLHPIVREIGLQKLIDKPTELKKAHIQSARHYTRHFYGAQMTERLGTLGGYFTEARYHLVQAGEQEELAQVAQYFFNYLSVSFNFGTPVPRNQEALNERIEVLASVLKSPGPIGLECHLARLYEARKHTGDIEKAIQHIRRVLGPKASAEVWVLLGKLLNQNNLRNEAIDLLRNGIQMIPVEKGVFALYLYCAEMLAQNGQISEAIILLYEGIGKIPVEKNLFSLYLFCAELQCMNSEWEHVSSLLLEAVEKVTVQYGGEKLIQALASYEAALGNVSDLHKLANKAGYAKEIAICFVHQLNQDWASAARVAESSSDQYVLILYEAFCRLGNNEPEKAIQVIEKSLTLRNIKGAVNTWLMSFAQYQAGNMDAARQYLSLYTGEEGSITDAGIRPALLRLWDDADAPWVRKDLASYFPILPAVLSGLPHAVSRQMYAPPVLPADLKTFPLTSAQPDQMDSNPAIQMLRDKQVRNEFDVFLCHNSVDKSIVKKIAEQLKQFGILPWLDEWELRPGRPWQRVLEAQIGSIKSVAVFVGPDGIGPWQHNELDAFLRQFVKRDIPVIPVLLPECDETPTLPVFLESFTWVDFRKETPNPYRQLVWGITGQRPEDLPLDALSQPAELLSRPSLIEELRTAVREEIARTREALMQQSDNSLRTILQHLTDAQVTTVQTLSLGIQEARFSEEEMTEMLHVIREIKAGLANDPALAETVKQLPDAVEDAKLGVAHKLKLSLPIVPFFLSYENEINLSSGLNLSKLVDNMLAKIRGKQ